MSCRPLICHLIVFAALLGGSMAQGLGPAPAPVEPAQLPADWAERDLEGKWVAYRRATGAAAADPRRKEAWTKALGAAGELELLEQIAIYEGWRLAGPELARLDAPQLLRAAAWNLGASDSHDLDVAEKAMRARGAVTVGWFEANPLAQRGKGAVLYRELAAQHEPNRDFAYLPAHDPMQVLVPWLDAPAALVEFGDRLRAEPRQRYVHQVLRALDGVVVFGRPDAAIVHKVLGLCRHPSDVVRHAAFAALTKVPGELVPYGGLIAMAGDDAAPAARRHLATMALSYSTHPQAFFALHAIAQSAGHPGRNVAILRLGELGDDTTLAVLTNPGGAIDLEVGTALQQAAARIGARKQERDFFVVAKLRVMLWRLAWLRATADPRAAEHGKAAAALLHALDPTGDEQNGLWPALDAALLPVAETPFGPDEFAGVERELQQLGAELRAR